MKKKLLFKLLLLGIGLVGLWMIIISHPPGPRLVCHRALDGALDQWLIEMRTNDVWLPNINGSSRESLAVLQPIGFPDKGALADYNYIPGLKKDDPGDLIVMYTTEPSRRRWHGDREWYQHEKKWIVLNVNFDDGKREPWEMNENNESMPTEEFTNRLAKTLTFLTEQKRPYWTNVVKEHSTFLDAVRRK